MHDCLGNRLHPFDRVRAATVEELATHGHPGEMAESLSPTERTIIATIPGPATCNVVVADSVGPTAVAGSFGTGGIGMFPFQGGTAWVTAYKLVRVEG